MIAKAAKVENLYKLKCMAIEHAGIATRIGSQLPLLTVQFRRYINLIRML